MNKLPQAGELRPMIEQDLAMVLAWRNSDRVRSVMFHQELITAAKHREWFSNKTGAVDSTLLIFRLNSIDCGFLGLHTEPLASRVEWGFYLSPEAKPGAGALLGKAGMRYAFDTLSMHKLVGHVLEYNTKSLRYHEKLGFTQEGILRDHHFDGAGYVSTVCYGLLQDEWRTSPAGGA